LAICDAATRGPWEVRNGVEIHTASHRVRRELERETGKVHPSQFIAKTREVYMDRTEREANAQSIAASRNQRPGELRAMLKRCAKIEDVYDHRWHLLDVVLRGWIMTDVADMADALGVKE